MRDDEFISHTGHFQAAAEVVPFIDQDLNSSGNDHSQCPEDLSVGSEDLLYLALQVDAIDSGMLHFYVETIHILHETVDNIASLDLP